MRFIFIGKNHEFSLVPLKSIAEHHELVGVVESGPRSSQSRPEAVSRQIFPFPRLGKSLGFLSTLAKRKRIPYMLLTRENRDDLAAFLRAIQPDIICVASLSQLLKKDVLHIPKYGAINLHPSLLPKYHGPFPWFWQYLNFEKEWGVTVHKIDEGQDTGPLVKQESFELPLGTDIADAMKMVAPIGARLMLEAMNAIEVGIALRPQPQHDYPKARIVQRDEKFIDWDVWDLERVWHFMRGTYPWIDAVEYPEEKDTHGTWRIGEMEKESCAETPGKVFKDEKGYFVAHKEGKVRLYWDTSSASSMTERLRKLLGF